MKLKDLNPQPGQVYERIDYTPKQVAMIDYSGRHATIVEILSRSMSCVLFAQVEGDWHLLQPAPVLGEAFPIEAFDKGDRVIAQTPDGNWLTDGKCLIDGMNIAFLEDNGCVYHIGNAMAATGWKLYFAPPLPALPPEPSLREKIEKVGDEFAADYTSHRTGYQSLVERLCAIDPQIASLLGGSHEK